METKLTDVKNRQKRIQILKLVFFTLTLHFLTSNEITTHRILSLPLTTSIYLVFLPLEIQTDQLYHAFLNLFEKNRACTQTDIRFFFPAKYEVLQLQSGGQSIFPTKYKTLKIEPK